MYYILYCRHCNAAYFGLSAHDLKYFAIYPCHQDQWSWPEIGHEDENAFSIENDDFGVVLGNGRLFSMPFTCDTFICEGVNIKTGVARTFDHKVDSINQTAQTLEPLMHWDSTQSPLNRFKLLRINGDVRSPIAGKENHARGHELRFFLCIIVLSMLTVTQGKL